MSHDTISLERKTDGIIEQRHWILQGTWKTRIKSTMELGGFFNTKTRVKGASLIYSDAKQDESNSNQASGA